MSIGGWKTQKEAERGGEMRFTTFLLFSNFILGFFFLVGAKNFWLHLSDIYSHQKKLLLEKKNLE